MKTLSIRQPHVAAIFADLKPWETRSWATKYRGPLAIHAALTIDRDRLEPLRMSRVEWEHHLRTVLRPRLVAVGTGVIVGVVDLVDCIPTTDVPRAEREWGDFSEGRFAWRLARPRLLLEPVPARGLLSLWKSDVIDPGLKS